MGGPLLDTSLLSTLCTIYDAEGSSSNALPYSHTSPYIPYIPFSDLKTYIVTQNLASISSSDRFFIAQSNTVEKQKAVWQMVRHRGLVGMEEGLVIERNGENGGSEQESPSLFHKTQLQEFTSSGLSL